MSHGSDAVLRIASILGCLLLASCGGSEDTSAEANTQAAVQANLDKVAEAASGPVAEADIDANVAKAERIVKDQYFPDQVDHSGSAKYQREWYMVKGAVQQAGYPCAAVAYVQQTMDGTFKAVCKVALHTNKFDAFTIDPDAQTVVPYQ